MINNNLNLYQLNRQISLFLMGWGVSSMILRATLFFFDNQFLRAISIQFLLWGLIDFILGVIPIARNKISQRKKLYKILFINSFLGNRVKVSSGQFLRFRINGIHPFINIS